MQNGHTCGPSAFLCRQTLPEVNTADQFWTWHLRLRMVRSVSDGSEKSLTTV